MLLRASFIATLAVTMMQQPVHAQHPWPQEGLHWPGSPEATVMVSNRSGYDASYAIAMWDASPEHRLVDVGPVCPGWTPHRCVTIYRRSVPGPSTGRAWVRVPNLADRHILAADIHVDDGLGHAESRALLAHEVGHALGLGHRDSGIMKAWHQAGARPDGHDFEQLRRH